MSVVINGLLDLNLMTVLRFPSSIVRYQECYGEISDDGFEEDSDSDADGE